MCLRIKVIQYVTGVLLNNEFITFCPKYFQNYPLFYRNKLCLKLTEVRYSHAQHDDVLVNDRVHI